MKHTLSSLALATLCVALAGPASAGGTIVKLDGKANVDRKGEKVEAAESFQLQSGDTLSVAERSKAQVRFEDDSVFVIPGTAKFRVDEFRMPVQGKGGKAIYTLLEGGVHTITGKVGKLGTDQYELRTDEATVTVAGSAYLAMRCLGTCAAKYKTGLYVGAENGTITVANPEGKLKLTRGQTAYVASGAAPILVKKSPFKDTRVAGAYDLDLEFDVDVHPPRIEPEPPASPS